MEDFIPMMVGVVFYGVVLLLPGATVIVLLVVLMQRTARVAELGMRLDKVETMVRRQRQPASETEVEEPATALPIRPARAERQPARTEAEHVESWIGRRALGWVAVGLLLFAVAFFL